MIYKESEQLEIKSSFKEWKEIIISLVAFANKEGGKVIVGFDDNGNPTNQVVGKNTIEDLGNKIKNNTDPVLYPSIVVKTFALGEITEFEVKEAEIKPVFAFNKAFVRVGKSNQKLSNQEVRNLIKRYTLPDFDKQFFTENIENIEWDEKLISQLNKNYFKIEFHTYFDFLKSLNIYNGKNITNAAYLCFVKKNSLMPNAIMKAARFKGNSMVHFIDMKDFDTNIITAVEDTLEFIKRHINMSVEIDQAPQRKEIWAYPLNALREAIINAVVHRDYADHGNIQIRIFDDTLQIWSPGLLPPEINIKKLLSENRSIPRNKKLAQIFYNINLIENWGTGFLRIIDACLQKGLQKPSFEEKAGAFVITFFRKNIKKKLSGGVNEGVNGGVNGGVNTLLQIIKKYQGKNTRELSEIINKPYKTTEKWLKKLKDSNKIIFKGSPKTGGYFAK